jgi:phage shock protein C
MARNDGKWLRSRDRMIGGVCGGIAQALGWPPDRLRLAWAILTIITGCLPGIILYLALWFVMPEAEAAALNPPPP